MKQICTSLLLSFTFLLNAQTAPDWQWLRGGGSQNRGFGSGANNFTTHDGLSSMVLDDSANVYLSGYMREQSTWAGVDYAFPNYNPSSNTIVFLSKFDACGNHKWTKYIWCSNSQYNTLAAKKLKDNSLLWLYQGYSQAGYPTNIGSSPTSIDTTFFDNTNTYFDRATTLKLNATTGKIIGMYRIPDQSGNDMYAPFDYVETSSGDFWGRAGDGIFLGNNFNTKLFFMKTDKNFVPIKSFAFSRNFSQFSMLDKDIIFGGFKEHKGQIYGCGIVHRPSLLPSRPPWWY